MAPRNGRVPVDDTAPMRHSPFSSLAGAVSPASAVEVRPSSSKSTGPARAVLRLERKGHGGKEATVVSHLELSPKELDAWMTALKSQLGCGGRVEGDEIVIQGDQRDRLEPLLISRGVRKVTRG